MIIIEGQHLCMLMRGIKQTNSIMSTSTIRWDKKEKQEFKTLKEEALKIFFNK